MWKNYLKIAWRHILKYKSFALINVAGLAVGMACCLFIVGFILSELSYDRYHEKADRIYRITSKLTLGGTPNLIATTNVPPAVAMRDAYPEVIQATRLRPMGRVPVKQGTTEFYEDHVVYAEPSLFDLFTFPTVKGDPRQALASADGVVLTETTARRYFGEASPLGKTLRVNDQRDYTVTGVVQDVPPPSHFTFDVLLPFEGLFAEDPALMDSWSTPFGYYSYILLDEQNDYQHIERQLPALVERHVGDTFRDFGAAVEYYLQPVTSIHLYANLRHEIAVQSDIKYVYIFGGIAFFVLLIACFNFVSLATARSVTRAGEVGIRKVLGADRRRLMLQFLGESILYSLLALLLALALVQAAIPAFQGLTERSVGLDFWQRPGLLIGVVGMALLVGLLAGSYPAFLLSSFRPAWTLKGHAQRGATKARFRKVLVTTQFSISVVLIVCTGVIFNQLAYLKTKDLGFNQERVIVVPLTNPDVRPSVPAIKAAFERSPDVISVAAASHVMGQRSSGGTYRPEGYADGQTVMLDGMTIDQDYLATLDMKLVAGRNFSEDHPSDPQASILINEAAAREIGWADPIGKTLAYSNQPEGKTIIGVVKDFHFKSPHTTIRGLYISHDAEAFMPYRALLVKVRAGDMPAILDFLAAQWRAFDASRLDYYFLDAAYGEQYRADERLGKVISFFTFMALFIACLGLFGMSLFMTQRRRKEIGIRKVLGASMGGIIYLLSREYIGTFLISFLIAIPVAYMAMHQWLQSFAYRVEIGLGLFVLAGALAFGIAIISVGYQSIRAALTDPVKTLRYE